MPGFRSHADLNGDEHLGRTILSVQRQLDRNPNSAELHVQLGRLFHQCGQLLPASRQAETAIELDCQLFEAWKLQGDIDFSKSRWAEALANYQHAINLRPDNVEALQAVAICYLRQNRPVRAASTVESLVQQFEGQEPPSDVLTLYGNVMVNVGQHAQAADAFAQVCAKDSASADDYVRLSHAQLLAGNRESSVQTLLLGQKRFPTSQSVHELVQQLSSSNQDVSQVADRDAVGSLAIR